MTLHMERNASTFFMFELNLALDVPQVSRYVWEEMEVTSSVTSPRVKLADHCSNPSPTEDTGACDSSTGLTWSTNDSNNNKDNDMLCELPVGKGLEWSIGMSSYKKVPSGFTILAVGGSEGQKEVYGPDGQSDPKIDVAGFSDIFEHCGSRDDFVLLSEPLETLNALESVTYCYSSDGEVSISIQLPCGDVSKSGAAVGEADNSPHDGYSTEPFYLMPACLDDLHAPAVASDSKCLDLTEGLVSQFESMLFQEPSSEAVQLPSFGHLLQCSSGAPPSSPSRTRSSFARSDMSPSDTR